MRICITGIGVVSPLGCGVRPAWKNLVAGKSGVVHLGKEYEELPSQIGGRVSADWDATQYIDKQGLRRIPLFAQYAIGAADMALEDAQFDPKSCNSPERVGVAIGSGIGGFDAAYDNSVAYHTGGYRKVSPLFVPNLLSNMAAGHVSMRTGFQGPNHSVATACTTGAHALGDAFNMIRLGMADAMLAGSTEAAIHPLSVAGFARARSLASNFNENPEQGSRPFDSKRDGFVIGEGAAVFMLENEEHATKRGARIYATIDGYGMSGDAHHITAPHSEGRGARNCMNMALQTGKVDPSDVGYINAHATSTPLGDKIEAHAIANVFNRDPSKITVSSTKGATGHLLGAAGSLESAFTVMALHEQIIPPTLNLVEPNVECDLDFVRDEPRQANGELKYAMSNSFGFGGTNASLLFQKY